MSTITNHNVKALREIQETIGKANEKKGFHEEGIPIIGKAGFDEEVNYVSKRLLLVITELSEAFEELRSGHGITDTYYNEEPGKEGKPEGFISEVSDAIIRLFDLGYELDIDIPAMIQEKLEYNSTRPYKHGRKF